MTAEELNEWAADFLQFCSRFAAVFRRKEPRAQATKYLRGLMAAVPRKNSWQVAEAIGDRTPDATQRLLYQAQWSADAARDQLLEFAIEVFGEEDAIGVVDESGFIKKGKHSVGVKRQYSGTAGKVENCQIGTFLSYATTKGHMFLDRCLYLPEEWCNDSERRERAKVPEDVVFQTKPEQAMAMLEHAWQAGVPMRWVAGDEVYGDSTKLRDLIAGSERLYVLAVRTITPVWAERPQVVESEPVERGRPRKKVRLAEGEPSATTVKEVVASWSEGCWQRLVVADGEKGLITYDWACQRIVEAREGLPGPDGWLIARRSISDPTDIAYYLSNAPVDTQVLKLAQVASTRYTVEQCIEEAKGETGLDEYEVRYWHSWHRHITLSMMAHAWLASVRYKATEKKGDLSPSWPS
ncbi:MAG: IS701 family transposase [Anderseniella sp.]|jgi:SRSO17 transposase|nr:IS701 family transposase [Anderseniella sp.]